MTSQSFRGKSTATSTKHRKHQVHARDAFTAAKEECFT